MGDLLSFLYTVVDTLSLIFFLDAFAQRRWDNWKFTLGIGCLVALNFWILQVPLVFFGRDPAVKIGMILLSYTLSARALIMSRDFSRKTDESTLTTLCPRCLDAFRNARGIRVRRADPRQTIKEPCTYCQTRFGFDYYIQPTSPKTTYFKKGRFDDESECA